MTSGPLAFSLHSILLARVLLDAPLRADMVGDNGGRGMAAEPDATDAAGFCEAPLSAILALETVGVRSLPFRVGVTVACAVTGASETAELVRERDKGQGMRFRAWDAVAEVQGYSCCCRCGEAEMQADWGSVYICRMMAILP